MRVLATVKEFMFPESHAHSFASIAYSSAYTRHHYPAAYKEVLLNQMERRLWVLLGPHINAYLYDQIQAVTSEKEIYPSDIYHFTSPEEASALVREHNGVALLPRTAAWRIARDGITIRPLAENRLRLVVSFAVRADSKSRLVNEFVKAAGRKLGEVRQQGQGRLPLTG